MITGTRGDKVFNVCNLAILSLLVLVTLYPFWYVLLHAFNDGVDARLGGLWLFVRKFSWANFRVIWRDGAVPRALVISVLRTAVGAGLSVLCISLVGYALARNTLPGRRLMNTLITFTLFFSGGIIPFYLLMRSLHLLNNYLVYILPNLLSAFLLIVVRTYFTANIPPSLEESARIDGAGDLRIFFSIVFPTSLPIVATVALFCGVMQWNDWFSGYIFMTKANKIPLQTILVRIINQARASDMVASQTGLSVSTTGRTGPTAESVRSAVMVFAIVPIVLVYPLLQRYFVKGVMIGSIKE